MDLICPIYWLDENLFFRNVQSWIKELPLNKLILGVNNPKLDLSESLYSEEKEIISQDWDYIDQLHLKTLGACLADLMKRVETDWFIYVHSDAFITPYAFEVMKPYIKKEVGIIESERLHWDGTMSLMHNEYEIPFYTFDNYYNIDRACSGFQIFQKKAVQSAINMIEDDYIYRNEDLIFQFHCLLNGFTYQKTLAMHIHQTFNTKWTFPEDKANLMQVKGLIKYTNPLPRVTKMVFLNALKYVKINNVATIYELLKFCDKLNKKRWNRLLLKKWDEL